MVMISSSVFAQKPVTHFMGIPVDGSKKEMIMKLEGKGFKYDRMRDRLKGEFNGEQVTVLLHTNKNKVWRIALIDELTRTEADIRIRFNKLYNQFKKNKKYTPLTEDMLPIPNQEDISNGISQKEKQYAVAFSQFQDQFMPAMSKEAEEKNMLKAEIYFEQNHPRPKYGSIDKSAIENTAILLDVCEENIKGNTEGFDKRIVWFIINKVSDRFNLTIFYDNEYNHANGEDL